MFIGDSKLQPGLNLKLQGTFRQSGRSGGVYKLHGSCKLDQLFYKTDKIPFDHSHVGGFRACAGNKPQKDTYIDSRSPDFSF